MRIVSWNLNGLMASINNGTIGALETFLPDVICLQEIRTQQEPNVVDCYYHFWNHGEIDGYSGTAILSWEKPLRVFNGFLGDFPDDEGRLITAEFPDFFLVNAYVPNSQKNLKRQSYRLQWDEALREHVRELLDEKATIVCGDFNVARGNLDIYEENMHQYWDEQGCTSDERSNFETLLEEGLIDAYRALHPTERSYTWWSNRLNKKKQNRGWRLDYFLVSQDIFDSVAEVRHLADIQGSDHCPIELEVSF